MLKIAITIRKKEDQTTFFLNNTYYQFLSPFFDIELIAPRINHNYNDIVSRNDALLICGGYDIDPSLYHQVPHHKTHKEDKQIEFMDIDLFHQFYKAKKPIIGICRGIQVINVLLKGTLYQDIPSQYKTTINHAQEIHSIFPVENTLFSHYFPNSIKVNSFHHQNIHKLSSQLRVNALSEDGLIEGVENDLILAFQWHPERLSKPYQREFIKMITSFIRNVHLYNSY